MNETAALQLSAQESVRTVRDDLPLCRLEQGNALEVLRRLPAVSVHCCVTSPPYWGLRDYGTEPAVWGGKDGCEHAWEEAVRPTANGASTSNEGETLNARSATRQARRSAFCSRCGAWKRSLGLEPTPELYVGHLVMVLREVKRVLRKDGTLWLNLGDSYAGSWGGYSARAGGWRPAHSSFHRRAYANKDGGFLPPTANHPSLAPRSLAGIP